MTLKECNFKIQYRSDNSEEIISEFYLPALSQAIEYKRAVGFFSSSSLAMIATGLSNLIKNKGNMKLIISQKISREDAEAIEKGYKSRQDIIEENLLKEFSCYRTDLEKERYNYLAHLISNEKLDIKVAIIDELNNNGMYHEKIGLMKDTEGNIVAFSGSLNESKFAYSLNFESIDIYCSWLNEIDKERTIQKELDFDRMWEDKTSRIKVYDFPVAVKDKILQFKKNDIIPEENFNFIPMIKELNRDYISTPYWFKIRSYQQEAILSWKNNNCIGLYNMATGTGKTLTALASIVNLSNYIMEISLLIIIVCPYKHLVEQWSKDAIEFNLNPIIAYSDYKYSNWSKRLSQTIFNLESGAFKRGCVITTNSTYKSRKFQDSIKKCTCEIVLVMDEAHNAGSNEFSGCLLPNIKYRLALSATPERHNDLDGTEQIIRYFGKEVYELSLKRAIEEGFLTNYFYFPQVVYLTEEEREEYVEISKKIAKYVLPNGELKACHRVEKLLIKRARILAGAKNKIQKLRELMKGKEDGNYNLVYCGATTVEDESDEGEAVIRQIDAVCNLLGNELDMKIAKFTSAEDMDERKEIIKKFSDGQSLQAIVAIKCLDEGVNIPAIQNAFILASSTNPREFIQRRGRVLRTHPGKVYAYIYDFITLPRELTNVYNIKDRELKSDLSIIKREVIRAREFASLARNKYTGMKTIDEILSIYDDYIEQVGELNEY